MTRTAATTATPRAASRKRTGLALLAALLATAGCGQTGPLTLATPASEEGASAPSDASPEDSESPEDEL